MHRLQWDLLRNTLVDPFLILGGVALIVHVPFLPPFFRISSAVFFSESCFELLLVYLQLLLERSVLVSHGVDYISQRLSYCLRSSFCLRIFFC